MQINMSLHPQFEELYNQYANDKNGVKLLDIDGISPRKLDIGALSYDFFESKLADIATDSNSNAVENTSPTTYRAFVSNNQMKLLGFHMLWYHTMKRYGLEVANQDIKNIWDGALYFHDAHGVKIQMPYCYAFSLMPLVYNGRPYGTSPNTPPKYRKSFLSQVDKLIGDLSKQFAGATAPSDFFLWYAYFCKKEGLSTIHPDDVETIVNDLQGLVCLFNDESRAEGEAPFTNISLYDMEGLKNLFSTTVYPDGSEPDLGYIMDLQKIFGNWFRKGDPITGFPYRFPVVTINLTTDNNKFMDEDFAGWAAMVNRNMGNFNLHWGDKAKLAMCCRYENNLSDMGLTPDSFGNGGLNIGSHRVVTVNLPRIAIMAGGDEDVFYAELDRMMESACRLLLVHRYDILQKRVDKNPEYLRFFGKLGWFDLDTMFSTFGITGVHEMCEIMGYDIMDDDGTDFALDVLQYMRDRVMAYRMEHGIAFNIEEIPGEQACVALLQKDKITLNPDLPYKLYSNQYIPLTAKAGVIARLDLSGRFMKMVSGGGIVHLNVEHQLDHPGKVYELMHFAMRSGVSHMAICHRFGMCVNGHTNIVGQSDTCPVCGEKIVRARNRVIGYYSDEFNWHPVRQKHDARLRYFSDPDNLI